MIESETYELTSEFYEREKRKNDKFTPIKEVNVNRKYVIHAFDVETYERNGNLLCLCLSDGNKLVIPNQSPDFELIYQFFLPYINDSRNKYYFFGWNSAFDFMIMLKGLGKELKKMYDDKYVYKYKDMTIKYIYKKALILARNGRTIRFYDIMKFFGGGSLDKVSKKFLKEGKRYDGKYQDKKFPDSVIGDPIELKKIVDYCLYDCSLTQRLAEFWITNFHKSFNFYPKHYISAGTLAFEFIKTKLDRFPNYVEIPNPVQVTAYRAFFGGRFEIYKRGHYKNVHHYDINSAYPDAMANFPDFFDGKWQKITSIEQFNPNQVGFYQIDLTIKESCYIPPLLFRAWHNIYAPYGTFRTWATSYELAQLLEGFDLKVDAIKGYQFVPGNNQDLRFNELIKMMYAERLKQKDEGIKYVFKVLLNSIYGKTAQRLPTYGKSFSPVMCALTTGKCRSKLLEAIKQSPKDILAVATDGIFSLSKLNLPTPADKKLGEFSYEYHSHLWLGMSGIYTYATNVLKTEHFVMDKLEYKTRGFNTHVKDSASGKKKPFDLSQIQRLDQPLTIYQDKAHTLAQSIRSNIWEQIGYFETQKKIIDLNKETKRRWNAKFKTINCQQDSEPWNVKQVVGYELALPKGQMTLL